MTRMIIAIGFLCAFAAGFALNLGWNQGPAGSENERGRGERGSWLAERLDLSQAQQEQMKEIWSDVAQHGNRNLWEQRRTLRQERDQAIAELIGPEDRAAYEQIVEKYQQDLEQVQTQWRRSYESAVEQTKALLTAPQREKYEQILDRQKWNDREERRRGSSRSDKPDATPE